MSTVPPQQPPAQGYPPQGYPQQPPKKKHTVRNVLLVLVLLLILVIGGCMALLGTAANQVDKAIKQEDQNNRPAVVSEGAAFTHDGYKTDAGWRVVRDGLGSVTIKGLRVTNTANEARSAQFTFRFYKGKENLAEVECTSNEMQASEASKLDCVSLNGSFPKGYTVIKVSDMW